MSQIKIEENHYGEDAGERDPEQGEVNLKLPDQFEDDMQGMIESMIMRPNSMFSEVILYRKEFVVYLEGKMKTPFSEDIDGQGKNQFDLCQHEIRNDESLIVLTSLLNSMLDIEKSKK